ncbi:MAG: SpvB/TcaC N-terminal domain-containing protein [Thiolinea sp.]
MHSRADQTGVPISLPKGGGAIQGIGETFQPNLFSGTGNFSVPIFTSPGRNGFDPELSLQYSSGNGNGVFGVGWQLPIPRITRKTEKGLPTYRDSEDVFVMSGAEDLVPYLEKQGESWVHITSTLEGYTITRYRPRTEGQFALIERWQSSSGEIHWRVTTKENITSIYGRSPEAKVIDPGDPKRIYEWLLEETFDAKGNHILYRTHKR